MHDETIRERSNPISASQFTANDLQGIIPPLLTPTTGDRVDPAGVQRLVAHVLAGGVHALFVAGTTGEFASLSEVNWRQLVATAIAAVDRRRPVLAGISQNGTAETIRYAGLAAELGADFVVATTPSYFRHSQAELIAHFTAIADASPHPLLLYNIPQNTANELTLATVTTLARHPNIIGLKDSAGDFERIRRLRLTLGPAFRLLAGTDMLGDLAHAAGANGTVPSLANLVPALLVAAWDAAVTGDTGQSRALHEQIAQLTALYAASDEGDAGGFIAALRCALSLIGLPVGPALAPIAMPDPAAMQRIAAILGTAGLRTGTGS